MALIPYRDVPETDPESENGKKDPSLVLAGMPAEEYYCGDERCDCATGHLLLGGLHLTVDLGTTRVDFADSQASQGREVLQQTVRQALQAGAINQ